jgi:hypothetical protein
VRTYSKNHSLYVRRLTLCLTNNDLPYVRQRTDSYAPEVDIDSCLGKVAETSLYKIFCKRSDESRLGFNFKGDEYAQGFVQTTVRIDDITISRSDEWLWRRWWLSGTGLRIDRLGLQWVKLCEFGYGRKLCDFGSNGRFFHT